MKKKRSTKPKELSAMEAALREMEAKEDEIMKKRAHVKSHLEHFNGKYLGMSLAIYILRLHMKGEGK